MAGEFLRKGKFLGAVGQNNRAVGFSPSAVSGDLPHESVYCAAETRIPTVSVVIATYNRAALIGGAVASVLNQSFTDFELIVVDDGSTDDSIAVICSFNDPRLVLLKQENRGRSAARNRALRMARGRYIAFLDSDDEYLREKLSRQVTFMDSHPEIGMVYTSAYCINERGESLEGHHYKATVAGDIYRDVAFFRPVTITLPTVMLRREVLETVGLFDEAMERFEDTDLWRRIAKRFHVGVIESPTCRLRTHAENVLASQDANRITSAIEFYIEKIFREDADVDSAFLRRNGASLYEYYGKAFLTVKGWRCRGFALLGRAALLYPPRSAKAILGGVSTLLRSVVRQCIG